MTPTHSLNGQSETCWPLQCVNFGIGLADKQIRKRLVPDDFCCTDLGCAVAEMQNGGGKDRSYHFLQKLLLEAFHVSWSPKDGNPVDSLIKRLKLDAKKGRILQQLCEVVEIADQHTDIAIDKFFQEVQILGRIAGKD